MTLTWQEHRPAGVESLWDLVSKVARETPEAVFLAPAEKALNEITYAQLTNAIRSVAAKLEAHGVSPGDRVVTILPNSTLAALLFVTVIASGRTLVPINPASSAAEVHHILTETNARVVVADASLAKRLNGLRDDILFVSDSTAEVAHLLNRAQLSEPGPAPEIAEVVYTSGSSGQPKGVMLSHQALLSNSFALGHAYEVPLNAKFLALCPLFHNSGQIFTTLTPIWVSGTTTAVRSELALHKFWELVSTYRPDWLLVMNAFIAMALEHSQKAPDEIPLKGVLDGGSPLSRDLFARFEAAFGVPVYHVYGLTETTSVATGQRPGKESSDRSAGTALDNCQVRLHPDGGAATAHGAGEIQIRGSNLFSGYLNRPALTEQKIYDGWLNTGDLGFLDRGGNLTIVDRVDNMIIVGGENVYPGEIEALAHSLSGVLEMVVVAAPDVIRGNRLVLVYSSVAGVADTDIAAWRQILGEKLSTFKIPTEFVSLGDIGLDDFPRSANNKILRHEVTRVVCERYSN
jgi:acyl-CoA synthetase (AMP-forming)/AMP-acid ligase II